MFQNSSSDKPPIGYSSGLSKVLSSQSTGDKRRSKGSCTDTNLGDWGRTYLSPISLRYSGRVAFFGPVPFGIQRFQVGSATFD